MFFQSEVGFAKHITQRKAIIDLDLDTDLFPIAT